MTNQSSGASATLLIKAQSAAENEINNAAEQANWLNPSRRHLSARRQHCA